MDIKKLIEKEFYVADAFPIETLPDTVQEIIHALHENLKWPKDYIASAMLYAVSVAAGSRFRVRIKFGWTEGTGMYIIFVGNPGMAKTHSLKWPIRPIVSRDRQYYKEYLLKMAEFERVDKMSQKERNEENITENPEKPSLRKKIVDDVTTEGLIKVLSENPDGLGLVADEATSWFKNFNRYNKGSDDSFWLSLWSQTDIVKDRAGSASVRVTKPFLSLIGGIQPKLLTDMQEAKMDDNGMLDRILFAWPENQDMQLIPDEDIPMEEYKRIWDQAIWQIMDYDHPLSAGFDYHEYTLTPDARTKYFEWDFENVNEANKSDQEWEKGMRAKMRSYVLRLSLVIELMKMGLDPQSHIPGAISFDSLDSATRICDYFMYTGTGVREQIYNLNPLKNRDVQTKRFYADLPDVFKRSEVVELAKSHHVSLRSLDRLLKNKDLFTRRSFGVYEKTTI